MLDMDSATLKSTSRKVSNDRIFNSIGAYSDSAYHFLKHYSKCQSLLETHISSQFWLALQSTHGFYMCTVDDATFGHHLQTLYVVIGQPTKDANLASDAFKGFFGLAKDALTLFP